MRYQINDKLNRCENISLNTTNDEFSFLFFPFAVGVTSSGEEISFFSPWIPIHSLGLLAKRIFIYSFCKSFNLECECVFSLDFGSSNFRQNDRVFLFISTVETLNSRWILQRAKIRFRFSFGQIHFPILRSQLKNSIEMEIYFVENRAKKGVLNSTFFFLIYSLALWWFQQQPSCYCTRLFVRL